MKLLSAAFALVVVVPSTQALESDGSCRLLSLFPFSDTVVSSAKGGTNRSKTYPYVSKHSRWSPETISMTGFTYTAALLMAIDHFNNRDASVVPELADLPESCTAFFSNDSSIIDSALSNKLSGELLLEASLTSKPCIILGPYGEGAAFWSSIVSASLNVPQIFYSNVPVLATDPDQFSSTLRTTMRPDEYVIRTLTFLKHMKRDYLAVMHGGSDYDRTLSANFEQFGPLYNVTILPIKLYPPSPTTDLKAHTTAMFDEIKKSGIRTIFRTFVDKGTRSLELLADSAEQAGLFGDDYLYILDENVAPVDDVPRIFGPQPLDSPLDKLLKGSIVLSPVQPWETSSANAFVQSWRSQNATFVNLVNERIPLKPEQQEYFQAASDFFQTTNPRRGAAHVYDSVMAAGFGACQAQMNNYTNNMTNMADSDRAAGSPPDSGVPLSSDNGPPPGGGQPPGGGPPPSGNGPPPESGPPPSSGMARWVEGPTPQTHFDDPHVNGIAESIFTGASGRVSFREGPDLYRDRLSNDISYGAYNIRSIGQPDGTRTYEVVLVMKAVDKEWQAMSDEAFVFRDGTSVLKGKSRELWDENFLPNWVQVFGLLLMSIAWIVTLGLLVAVWIWREKPLVKAGQPIFLSIVCLGSFLTSTAIFTLSFDEASGWTDQQLDAACTVTPWLFFLGINSTFTGLFCKLWRVDQVTQFRRRRVKVIQAAWPLILLLLSTAVCLLAWTVVDPWTWTREIIPESFPPESYGKCDSDKFDVYFSTLSGLMILATALAFAMAWKTKDLKLDSRFSDTNTVFLAIASQLQAWFVGLPILAVLKHSSVEATYLGRVLLIWLFSMASVLIVIAPKIYQTWSNPTGMGRTSRVFVSGLSDDTHAQHSSSNAVVLPESHRADSSIPSLRPSTTRDTDRERPLDTTSSSQTQKYGSSASSTPPSPPASRLDGPLSSVGRDSERLDV